ncbi:MAG TPA: hypothetical protein VNC59_09590, partial [Thermoanaerobaculia bacterium]|nr:hypothetical protein [Thermoanaerobaculia bacterium]
MNDPGLRVGFLSGPGGTLDYGRRFSRLRWRRRFPGRPSDELAPDADATRALAASEQWVLVTDETALPLPGPPPEAVRGRVVLAATLSPAAEPFVHTLRELETTPRAEAAPARVAAPCPAVSFSVTDFPPREAEDVSAYVGRLLSAETPHATAPISFAAVSFDEVSRGEGGERPEVIRLLPSAV